MKSKEILLGEGRRRKILLEDVFEGLETVEKFTFDYFLQGHILEAEVEQQSMKILSMYTADDNVCIRVKLSSVDAETELPVHFESWITIRVKKNKIVSYFQKSDLLSVLFSLGKMVIDQNDQVQVEEFIGRLKKMGLLPDSY